LLVGSLWVMRLQIHFKWVFTEFARMMGGKPNHTYWWDSILKKCHLVFRSYFVCVFLLCNWLMKLTETTLFQGMVSRTKNITDNQIMNSKFMIFDLAMTNFFVCKQCWVVLKVTAGA
jgi:hypothetical protein